MTLGGMKMPDFGSFNLEKHCCGTKLVEHNQCRLCG